MNIWKGIWEGSNGKQPEYRLSCASSRLISAMIGRMTSNRFYAENAQKLESVLIFLPWWRNIIVAYFIAGRTYTDWRDISV